MNVYWLTQNENEVPRGNDWLSDSEQAHLKSLIFLKRRADWRLGRWTAKCLMARRLRLPIDPDYLRRLEIVAAPSGAPESRLFHTPLPVTISISHRAGTGMCALAAGDSKLGCDLELIEPRSAGFVQDYFTIREQDLVAGTPEKDWPLVVNLMWSAKESALKALRTGLRLDTRSIEVELIAGDSTRRWMPLSVCCQGTDLFPGWWRREGEIVQTIVGHPASSAPFSMAVETTGIVSTANAYASA